MARLKDKHHQMAKKYIAILHDNVVQKKLFLENYKDVYKFPKTATNRNLRNYKRIIKYCQEILKHL